MKGHSTSSRLFLLFQEWQCLSACRNRLSRDVQCLDTCTLQLKICSASSHCCSMYQSATSLQWRKESTKKKSNGQICALSALKSSDWVHHGRACRHILRRWCLWFWPMACKKERLLQRFHEKASRCLRAAVSAPTHWCWRGVPRNRVLQAPRSSLSRPLRRRSHQVRWVCWCLRKQNWPISTRFRPGAARRLWYTAAGLSHQTDTAFCYERRLGRLTWCYQTCPWMGRISGSRKTASCRSWLGQRSTRWIEYFRGPFQYCTSLISILCRLQLLVHNVKLGVRD